MKTAGIYARVSTSDGKQNLKTQVLALKRYAAAMSWKVAGVYNDEITGASVARPGLDALMAAAARREFDTVLVFDLSRLTRRGPASAFELIARLRNSGVQLWSMNEEHFRTAGPTGELLIAIAAFLAQQERELLRARTRAGLDRARANGTALGRRPSLIDRVKVRALKDAGYSLREIAIELKSSKSVVGRTLAEPK
jgi:DNA invertase Pin-like site-specific DNA recombinase